MPNWLWTTFNSWKNVFGHGITICQYDLFLHRLKYRYFYEKLIVTIMNLYKVSAPLLIIFLAMIILCETKPYNRSTIIRKLHSHRRIGSLAWFSFET